MKFIRLFVVALGFSASPAFACWDMPDRECWIRAAQDEALAWVDTGPRIDRLYTLIDSGLVPPGADFARALLDDTGYDDLVAHELAAFDTRLPGQPEVDPYYLAGVYRLVEQTGDPALMREWYARIPVTTRLSEWIEAPEGAADPTPMVDQELSDDMVQAVKAIRAAKDGRIAEAEALIAETTGEPLFIGWKVLARQAIAAGDMALLRRAIPAMQAAIASPAVRDLPDDTTVAAAIAGAEQSYARSGDPDDLVMLYETLAASGMDLIPAEAALAPALADRYLRRQTGDGVLSPDGLETLLQQLLDTTALSGGDIELKGGIVMANAQTALRLGLKEEAAALVDLAFGSAPGVPGFRLYTLPLAPEPWANTWLDWMLARYDLVITRPDAFFSRNYWDHWVDQGATEMASDLVETLSRYARRDEARAFAEKVAPYLRQLRVDYAETNPQLPQFPFLASVAQYIYPPEQVIALRLSENTRPPGQMEATLGWELIKIGETATGLTMLEQAVGTSSEIGSIVSAIYRSGIRLDPAERARLLDVAGQEVARLARKYPMLATDLRRYMVLIAADGGDWKTARQYFRLLESEAALQPEAGPFLPFQAAISTYLAFAGLGPEYQVPAATEEYPYEDWAL